GGELPRSLAGNAIQPVTGRDRGASCAQGPRGKLRQERSDREGLGRLLAAPPTAPAGLSASRSRRHRPLCPGRWSRQGSVDRSPAGRSRRRTPRTPRSGAPRGAAAIPGRPALTAGQRLLLAQAPRTAPAAPEPAPPN